MSRALHLMIEGVSSSRRAELERRKNAETEIFDLTERNSREALEKIFAADAVAVWGPLLTQDSPD